MPISSPQKYAELEGEVQMADALPASASHPLEGKTLLVVRVGWLLLAAIQLLTFLPTLPQYFTLADHPCQQNCALTVQDANSVARAGFSPHLYALLLLAITLISVTVATTMAVLLFLRRSYDRMALIAAYFILILPTTLLINSGPTQ